MGHDHSTLKTKEITDLKNLTTFSQSEIQNWYAKFHSDCPSGTMNRTEFKAMYEQLFPDGDSSSFAEHVFRVYDQDGNGVIDFKEFLCTLSITSGGSTDEKLRWVFSLYDLDGNGYVTRVEIMEIVKAIAKMQGETRFDPEQAADSLFLVLDKNRDEKLSEMEFIRGAKSSPEVLSMLQADNGAE